MELDGVTIAQRKAVRFNPRLKLLLLQVVILLTVGLATEDVADDRTLVGGGSHRFGNYAIHSKSRKADQNDFRRNEANSVSIQENALYQISMDIKQ